MYFNVLGKHIVVLSSQLAAADLLEKRSAIYSSRPYFTMHKLYVHTSDLIRRITLNLIVFSLG